MKASEVIQAALDNHYRTKPFHFDKVKGYKARNEFMCHAIEEYIKTSNSIDIVNAMEMARKITCHFMPLIEEQDTTVLTNYLKKTNKRYAYFATRFGEFTPFCVKVRVKFWNDLIVELKEKGL